MLGFRAPRVVFTVLRRGLAKTSSEDDPPRHTSPARSTVRAAGLSARGFLARQQPTRGTLLLSIALVALIVLLPLTPGAPFTPAGKADAASAAGPARVAFQAPGANLLLNPSFETVGSGFPASWQQRATGFPDAAVFHSGSAALRVEGPATGAATTYSFQSFTLTPGAAYTLSVWAKTQGVTGPGLSVRYAQTNPTTVVWSTTRLAGTADWTQLTTSFTAPANTVAGRVDLVWDLHAGDKGWFDDVQLVCTAGCSTPAPTATATATSTSTPTATPTPTPTPTLTAMVPTGPNLLQNPSLETLGNGFPVSWQQRSTAFADPAVFHGGSAALRVEGPATGAATTYSFQSFTLTPGAAYTLSVWAKTQDVTGPACPCATPRPTPRRWSGAPRGWRARRTGPS